MENMIINDVCWAINNKVMIQLKENYKYYTIFLAFNTNDTNKENIILFIKKGINDIIYFTKDNNVDEYEYILEKMLNYNCNRYIKNKILKYFKDNNIEVVYNEI